MRRMMKLLVTEVLQRRHRGRKQIKWIMLLLVNLNNVERRKDQDLSQTEKFKLFRANFGNLHDLFYEIEKEHLELNQQQLDALESTPFWNLLQVFMNKQITRDELCKCAKGLEKLIKTFKKTLDGNGGFQLSAAGEVFQPTPEEMAVIFGMQVIENGIEDKLLDERKVTATKNDLCIKYDFGEKGQAIKSTDVQSAILNAIRNGELDDLVRLIVFYICQTAFFTKTGNASLPCSYLVFVESVDVINRISWPHLIHKTMMDGIQTNYGDTKTITGCSFYLLYWFAEHCSLIGKRTGKETMYPRFARWDTWNISKAIYNLGSLPLTKQQAASVQLSDDLKMQVENGFEKKLITPLYRNSQLENINLRVGDLEKEVNILKRERDDRNFKLRALRAAMNQLKAKEIRDHKDVNPEMLQVMKKALEEDEVVNQQPQEEEEPAQGKEPTKVQDKDTQHEQEKKPPQEKETLHYQEPPQTDDNDASVTSIAYILMSLS
ncbi:uncharacterized protein LOC113302330 [Papaver somniferum]|uniref:uncharacterized protein LOC113302330 n=1 Tax=Papaver somniferum TaxID=3469 RepID=UPI000E6F64A3|nr:uncharacterized protein LOC113302330 [Papaver somniferum]